MFSANHKIASNWFFYFTTQAVQYLLGNGVTFEDETAKDKFGKGFDGKLQKLATSAKTGGVAFAFFDVDKIDRPNMNACTDGVMKTVWLKEVVDDFNGLGEKGKEHRYGCSGIDGTAFGPAFGRSDGKKYLTVAYGIYGDNERTDNDRQVLLQYDVSGWDGLLRPLSQDAFLKSGPAAPDGKYFLFTGNTTWGVQNLEYDEGAKQWILCVYPGKKPEFPNYPTFVIDGAKAPVEKPLSGYADGTVGKVLTLRETGLSSGGISGVDFVFGKTGFYSFGDGRYFVSEEFRSSEGEQATNVCLYTLKRDNGVWEFIRKADK
jgi:hypothetical protein